jgi:hypothetical protein
VENVSVLVAYGIGFDGHRDLDRPPLPRHGAHRYEARDSGEGCFRDGENRPRREAVLDHRFSYDSFVAGTDADRQRIADDLAQELTRRVQASADPAQAASDCVDDLKSLGHDLWSFDESDDLQLWCGDWTAPERAFELFVEITYRNAEPRSVSVSVKCKEQSRP